MPNFSDVLNKKPSEVKELPPLPVGTYLSTVQGPHKSITAKSSGNTGYEFTLALGQPVSDVDTTQLSAAGGSAGKTSKVRFYSEFFLKQFLVDHLGLDPGEGSDEKNFAQLMSEAPGRPVLAHVTNQPSSKDPSRMTWFVAETSKA